jgi:hypothetical protein
MHRQVAVREGYGERTIRDVSSDGVERALGHAGALQEPDTALRLDPGSYFWGKST